MSKYAILVRSKKYWLHYDIFIASSKIMARLPIIESGLVPLTMNPFVRVKAYIADRVRPSKTVSMGYGITNLCDPIILVMHSLSLFVQVLYAPVHTRVPLPKVFCT